MRRFVIAAIVAGLAGGTGLAEPPAPQPVPPAALPAPFFPPPTIINAPRGPNQPPYPQSAPQSWITSSDYPSAALRQEITGTVVAEIVVNRWGYVGDCLITQSSGHEILDDATCRAIVRRARFLPATDGSGKAIAGKYPLRFVWALPDVAAPQPPASRYRIATDTYPRAPRLENYDWGVVREGDYPPDALERGAEGPSLISLEIDAGGKVTNCQIRQSSGDASLDAATCKLARERARFAPATDLSGRYAPGRALSGIDWRIDAQSARPLSPAQPMVPAAIPYRRSSEAELTANVLANGTVTSCQSGGDRLDGVGRQFFNFCDGVQRNPSYRFEPIVDASGNPIDATIRVRLSVEVTPRPQTTGK